eukprot:COSAG02_NODE_5815_length_4019_cov_1.827551_1_plen_154_part_10
MTRAQPYASVSAMREGARAPSHAAAASHTSETLRNATGPTIVVRARRVRQVRSARRSIQRRPRPSPSRPSLLTQGYRQGGAREEPMMDFDGCNIPMVDATFLLACNNGDEDRMQLLVEAGCDTKAKSNNGTNALMFAACSGAAAAVRAALDAGW